MTKAHAKPGTAESRAGAIVGSTPLPFDLMDAATQRENVRDFMRAMSAELSILAHRNGLESLALIFEMAREAAQADAADRALRKL